MFEEIAFKAELDRHVDPEAKEQAYLLCNEEPETRSKNIDELRSMIYVRYCHFREQNPNLWKGVDAFSLARLHNLYEGVLFDRPDVGRLIILRLGLWDPDVVSMDELLQGCLALLEVGIMQPKLQILGGTAMVDCEGMTMKQVRQFTPSVAVQIFNIMGYGFPIYQRGCHVVHCSRVFESLFRVFKRFAPDDGLWHKVYFHGYDMSSLHRHINPECLPERYGGYRQPVSVEHWLNRIKYYKNETFDKELRKLGYTVS